MTKNEIAELKELKAMLAGMTEAIVALTALVAELKAAPTARTAPTVRVVARKQPPAGNLNRFERAKLAVNEARGFEPHAYVKREHIDEWLAANV